MTYAETLEFLFSKLPMYQRIGNAAYKKDLTNIRTLCQALGHPQDRFRSIHIAGTNGKGSCSHMLSSVCQSSGLKTGLYTSPHLVDFRERIRLNGACVPEKFVIQFVENHRDLIETVQPSFFEITAAMAFDYFAAESVDVAVIETGLGGRLDSTNIIQPVLCLITNIDFDHMDLLGQTLEEIAGEKAGIIKRGIPVVIGESHPQTKPVFLNKALEQGAPITFADDNEHGLVEHYRALNRQTVRSAIRVLLESGFPLLPDVVEDAIEHAFERTGLKGRWQTLEEEPRTICDTGHNKAGMRWVLHQLAEIRHDHLHMVLGMVADKQHDDILSLLPKTATYYWCRPEVPRGLDAHLLREKAAKFSLNGHVYESVEQAYRSARNSAGQRDLLFVGGSTFVVGDLLKALGLSSCLPPS